MDEQGPTTLTGPTAPAGVRTGAVFAERYQLAECIGQDALGIRFRALDQEAESTVLLTVLPTSLVPGRKDAVKTRDDLRSLVKPGSLWMPGLLDADVEGSHFFTVESLPNGTTLRSVIADRQKHNKKSDASEMLPVVARLSTALSMVPKLIVGSNFSSLTARHGAVRMENIWVTTDHLELKGPFVLTSVKQGRLAEVVRADASISGTFAPEVLSGAASSSSDRFAVAAIVFEAMTGISYSPGQPVPIELGPLGDELGSLLAPRPEQRPETLSALIEALAKQAGLPVPRIEAALLDGGEFLNERGVGVATSENVVSVRTEPTDLVDHGGDTEGTQPRIDVESLARAHRAKRTQATARSDAGLDPAEDNAESGNAESDNAESDNAESDNAESDNAESDNAELDDVDTAENRPKESDTRRVSASDLFGLANDGPMSDGSLSQSSGAFAPGRAPTDSLGSYDSAATHVATDSEQERLKRMSSAPHSGVAQAPPSLGLPDFAGSGPDFDSIADTFAGHTIPSTDVPADPTAPLDSSGTIASPLFSASGDLADALADDDYEEVFPTQQLLPVLDADEVLNRTSDVPGAGEVVSSASTEPRRITEPGHVSEIRNKSAPGKSAEIGKWVEGAAPGGTMEINAKDIFDVERELRAETDSVRDPHDGRASTELDPRLVRAALGGLAEIDTSQSPSPEFARSSEPFPPSTESSPVERFSRDPAVPATRAPDGTDQIGLSDLEFIEDELRAVGRPQVEDVVDSRIPSLDEASFNAPREAVPSVTETPAARPDSTPKVAFRSRAAPATMDSQKQRYVSVVQEARVPRASVRRTARPGARSGTRATVFIIIGAVLIAALIIAGGLVIANDRRSRIERQRELDDYFRERSQQEQPSPNPPSLMR